MNNLIKINLNQTISKAQIDSIIEERNRWLIFGLVCTLFLASIGWFVYLNNEMDYIIKNRENTILSIKKNTDELKRTGKINLSKYDITTLNKFEQKRMFWAPKLIALAKITPENMAITGLNFENKKLKISAISSMNREKKDFDVVEDFMMRIDENIEFNKDFKDIKFDSMEKGMAKGQEVLEFAIEAKLK